MLDVSPMTVMRRLNRGLQSLAAFGPALNAQIASGTLDGDTHQNIDWSKTLALTMDGSKLAINDFSLTQRDRKPVAWQTLNVGINHLDLGSSTAQLGNVTLHGLKIDAHRLKNGPVDLTNLAKPSAPAKGSSAS